MRCPYCNYNDSKVIDSREVDEGRVIRRRRQCLKCGVRFSTYEEIEILNLTVIKKDGQREEYYKNKIKEGIKRAANKRLSEEEVNQLVSDIEAEINAKGKKEITSQEIGEIALRRLKEKDEVSYLRFASVFKSFGTGKRFIKELNKLEAEKEKERKISKNKNKLEK